MKVADVMSKQVDFVTVDTKVKDVCRLIFGRGINGVPVCKGKKVIGFVTERDILSKFYPSMQEYMEDMVHAGDFVGMEEKISEIFALSAEDIMSKNPTTITSDTPLLEAQSIMMIRKVGRLPVVDKKGNLVGILSKGDIFAAVVGDRLPVSGEEEFHDWLSKHYDLVTGWEKRLGNEIPDLARLFKKEKVKKIVDIGFGTGEHEIELAKKGFDVVGIERSLLMQRTALLKISKLAISLQYKIKLIHGDYNTTLARLQGGFDAVIFMGNAYSHIEDYRDVTKSVSKALSKKRGLIVLQIINFEKLFTVKNRFLDLIFNSSKLGIMQEHAFLRFYDSPRERGRFATLNMAIFDSDGKKWKFRSINSTPIAILNKKEIKSLLERSGFGRISFYGGRFLGPLFKEEFEPLKSDWLNVVARR